MSSTPLLDPKPDTVSVHGAALTRRGFLATGGALVVSLSLLPSLGKAKAAETALDPNSLASWLEIRADNTILIRTGRCDFGQGSIYTAYPQIVAEELDVPFDAITSVVSGDTDRTPDGGVTAGLITRNALNLRKVAAYTRQAILKLAADEFGVGVENLSVEAGIVSGGGKSATYGELVAGQDLQLEIPVSGDISSLFGLLVDGDPPMKPASSYTVVGQSHRNPIIAAKVSARQTWATDVKLPDMLHARVIHPPTLGSTLVAAGDVDPNDFPTSKVVVIGNLVGIVAETEWEAIQAAWDVAATTEWSEWDGLPGHANLFDHLRNGTDWDVVPATDGRENKGDAPAAIEGAAVTHAATYEVPFLKHAPIGPTMALADVRPDGSVTVHTQTQHPQNLRKQIALMLGISNDKVVIRTYPGSGHYGRSNGGNSGAEDEAVLLSKAVGRPVRLQWMRPEDLQWSTQSAPNLADIRIGVDAGGKIVGYQADHYGLPMQDDRPIGAVLAGLPTMMAPVPENESWIQGMANRVSDGWVYGSVENVQERAHSSWQLGQQTSPLALGLRDHSLRTPTQYQQHFPREVAISEAAALAGVDPLQFRLDNTNDDRLRHVLEVLRDETGWQPRPSPSPDAGSAGGGLLRGRGVSAMYRSGGYWACSCEVSVAPDSGKISVEKLAIVIDPGIVVNPMQLKRQVEAGTLMGVSHVLFEEVPFDKGAVTAEDWTTYPILTMGDTPDVTVILAPHPGVETYGQGSEGANAPPMAAIASAVFDATGKPARRIPLQADYVKSLLA